MDADRFDTLARALTSIRSRRNFARLLGGSVIAGAVVPGLLPRRAEANAKTRCRHSGGVFLSRGNCRCASKCPSTAIFACHGSTTCYCGETVEGRGFCGGPLIDPGRCTASTGCPSGAKCVFEACSDTSCTTATDCPEDQLCKRGTCQYAFCRVPCPT